MFDPFSAPLTIPNAISTFVIFDDMTSRASNLLVALVTEDAMASKPQTAVDERFYLALRANVAELPWDCDRSLMLAAAVAASAASAWARITRAVTSAAVRLQGRGPVFPNIQLLVEAYRSEWLENEIDESPFLMTFSSTWLPVGRTYEFVSRLVEHTVKSHLFVVSPCMAISILRDFLRARTIHLIAEQQSRVMTAFDGLLRALVLASEFDDIEKKHNEVSRLRRSASVGQKRG